MLDKSPFSIYLNTIYWAMTTMTSVGYGDMLPYTQSEKIYAIICMVFCCVIFAYTVGSIGNLMQNQDSAIDLREKLVHFI